MSNKGLGRVGINWTLDAVSVSRGAFMSGVWPVLSMRGYTLHNKDKVT